MAFILSNLQISLLFYPHFCSMDHDKLLKTAQQRRAKLYPWIFFTPIISSIHDKLHVFTVLYNTEQLLFPVPHPNARNFTAPGACIALYCTVQCSTVLYCTVLYCTVLYCVVLYCTLEHGQGCNCANLHCSWLAPVLAQKRFVWCTAAINCNQFPSSYAFRSNDVLKTWRKTGHTYILSFFWHFLLFFVHLLAPLTLFGIFFELFGTFWKYVISDT